MAPKYRRKTPPADRVYRSSPNLVQQKFPSLNKLSRAGTARDAKMGAQSTLTQMPFARQLSYGVEVADSEEEEDELQMEAPVKKRRRTGAVVQVLDINAEDDDDYYEEKPRSRGRRKKAEKKEDHDVVKVENKGNLRRTKGGKSLVASLKKQNTLTQMPWATSNMWPDEEEQESLFGSSTKAAKQELESKEIRISGLSSPPQRPKSTAHDRDKRIIPDSEDMQDSLPDSIALDYSANAKDQDQLEADHKRSCLLPLPRTPRKVWPVQIPSSQSPHATPITIHSRNHTQQKYGSETTTPTRARSTPKTDSPTRMNLAATIPEVDNSLDRDSSRPSTLSPVRRPPKVHSQVDLVTKDTGSPGTQNSKETNYSEAQINTQNVKESVVSASQMVMVPGTVASENVNLKDYADMVGLEEEHEFAKDSAETDIASSPPKSFVKCTNEQLVTSRVLDVQAKQVLSMAPPILQSLSEHTQINVEEPFTNTFAETQTQTQTTQNTRQRIQEFTKAMLWRSDAPMEHQFPTRSLQEPLPAAIMGLETQLAFMNDDLETQDIHSNVEGIQATDAKHPGNVPQVLGSSQESKVMETAPSPAAWKRRAFVPSSQQEEDTQVSDFTAEHAPTAQDGNAHLSAQEVLNISFSQASTVPGTPKRSQASRDLPTATQASRNVISLVTSTPERGEQEQTMSSSPINELVEESQFESQSLPEQTSDDGDENGELDLEEEMEDYGQEYNAITLRQARELPKGISQLLPSSMLNSSIALPPQWQDSVETEL